MKTSVAITSIRAHDAMQVGFAEMQSRILNVMKPGVYYSRRSLAKLTRLETSSVSGRVNELLKIGAIEVCGTMRCPLSGRNVEALKRADEQMELL